MAEEGEDDGLSPNETLDMISEDEATANTGDENDTEREARRARNRARAARRRTVNERIQPMHRELDAEFTVVSERGFRTPMANITRVTTILKRSNDPNLRQALRYTQGAWIQLDRQNPVSTIGEEHMGESHSQANSRTAGGRLRHQRSNNNDNACGNQATGGRQQPPPGGNPRQPNHPNHRNPQDLPIEDLRQKINEGRNARSIIDSRCREREVADPEGTNCSDRFSAFIARFNSYKYPEGFKPIGITKYDGKQAPQ
jgi:hypothetical protein